MAQITFRNDANLPDGDVEILTQLANDFLEKLGKKIEIIRSEVRIKEAKNQGGMPTMFEVLLEVFLTHGGTFVAEAENKELKPALQEAINEVDHQFQAKHDRERRH